MDKIFIKDIKINANHGVLAFEKEQGQDFYISSNIYLDLSHAGMSDDLDASINYAEITTNIIKYFTIHTFDLIEKAGEYVALNILHTHPMIKKIDLEIHKPHAPMDVSFKDVGIKITRERVKAHIALGSNLDSQKFGTSREIIKQAIVEINELEFTKVTKESTLIETEPYGVEDQPNFINGVIEIETLLSPYYLLTKLLHMELHFERVRKQRWGMRTLDLDLILYGNHVCYDETLILPHPSMHVRDFVLQPLCEISPHAVHPIFHETAYILLQKLNPVIDVKLEP